MQFPLTRQLVEEAEQYSLRSSCKHCLFYVEPRKQCAHEWPDRGQSRWPLDAPDDRGNPPQHVEFCKEFELL